MLLALHVWIAAYGLGTGAAIRGVGAGDSATAIAQPLLASGAGTDADAVLTALVNAAAPARAAAAVVAALLAGTARSTPGTPLPLPLLPLPVPLPLTPLLPGGALARTECQADERSQGAATKRPAQPTA
jgi:hypothetical protein